MLFVCIEVVRASGFNLVKMEERRKCTTVRQLELLVNFLKEHRDLALGRVRSKEARAVAAGLWRECAELLNVAGPARSAKEWSKVWNDLKCRIRAKLVNLKTSQQATCGGPSSAGTLTPIESRIAGILSRDDGPTVNVCQNQFIVQNNDDKMNKETEVMAQDGSETENVSEEIKTPLDDQNQPARSESAPSPGSSLTEHVPTPPLVSRRRLRGQRRTERAPYQHTARTPSLSNRTAIDEYRRMILRIETLRAEAAVKNADAALSNAEATKSFAEGLRLIAGSIDRFSQMFCQQRGERQD